MGQFVCKYKWPWVSADVIEAWENDAVPVGEYTTLLKAFDAAFGWTVQELLAFKRCLEEGFDVKVRCVPAQRKIGVRTPRIPLR